MVFGQPGEELRFVRSGFERSSVKLHDSSNEISVAMVPAVHMIEEVKIDSWIPTGDLRKDAKTLAVTDQHAGLRKEIGVPAPPEKPREVPPPTVAEVGTLNYLISNFNLNTLYKNIAGDGRRMRRLYSFEDQKELQDWVLKRFGTSYFTEAGIPEPKIAVFLDFVCAKDSDIQKYIKSGNSSAVAERLQGWVPQFLGLNEQK